MSPDAWIRVLIGLACLWVTGFALAYLRIRMPIRQGAKELTSAQLVQIVLMPPLIGITALVVIVKILGY